MKDKLSAEITANSSWRSTYRQQPLEVAEVVFLSIKRAAC